MNLRNSLFWRTFALIVLVVALVSTILFYFLHLRYHTITQREAEVNAVFLASQCVKPLLWDDRLQLKSLLSATVEKKVAEYAWLERDGKLLAHTFPQGVPKGLLDLHPRGGAGTPMQSWQDHNGRVFHDIAVPLPDPASGILHVGITEDAVNEDVSAMLPATAAIAMLSLALGAMLAWLMANAVTRETRSAAQALAESELKYRTLADNTTDWEFWIGPNEEPIYNSPSCEQIIGYTPAELAANPNLFSGMIHPDDLPRFAAHRHVACQDKQEDQLELRIVGKDGEIRWLSHRCRPVFGQAGEYLGTRGSNTDITERKQIEESLRENKKRLQEAQRMAQIGSWELDIAGNALIWSDEIYRIFEIDPASFSASYETFLNAIHPEDRILVDRAYAASVKNRIPYSIEHRLLFPDGRIKFVHERGETFYDLEGRALRSTGTVQDITERKQAELALRSLNESLESRIKEETAKNMEQERLLIQQSRLAAMGEMIGNIAHQWRQPINALTLLLTNIKDAYEYHELDKEYLDSEVGKGQQMIQKMSSTIDDFRNFFRPDKEKQRFLACDEVEEAIKMVEQSFLSHNVEIVFERCDEPRSVVGYPNEFAQVVLNALSNAKEAIIDKNGGSQRKIAGEIHIKVEHGETATTLSIRDNGGGIPTEILGKVFDPYFTTKERGTGIGLYMSRMILDHMGGNIAIHNIEDGAEVLITLPLARESTS